MHNKRLRIYLTGVGGQGTLTATTLLARVILDHGIDVVSGEIHGMAQRGGVVESSVLMGGWQSPSIYYGEADVLLGFELLETLRALPYLAPGGVVLSASEFVPPPDVNMGLAALPEKEDIRRQVRAAASRSWFIPISDLGRQAGALQSGNTALLGALCTTGLLPFGLEALKDGIRKYLPPKVAYANLQAADLGAAATR
ncbi:MAG: indolepyruvate oxidoreductase subunit beta [Desulfovibrio sp.]|jgi:indolepyruvate ferredoxin oxidoreductase beta subunit|nr:indolepyruvate oxidoreductase subunit beta [Desulfovibrio sp.]